MCEPITTLQDMHVHSTFSDGHDTLAANVAEAEAIGLVELGCVDHVRLDSGWLPEYVAELARVRAETSVTLHCGVEAKLLDAEGRLDLPADLDGVELVYVADHQMPCFDGPRNPREVREQIAAGALPADAVIETLVTATAKALRHVPHGQVVIAHLFSILPKLGLVEEDVPAHLLDALAASVHRAGARIEVSERWHCPSVVTLSAFLARDVPLLLSTDSHRRETIGRYDYVRGTVEQLGLDPPPALSGRTAAPPSPAARSQG